MGRIATRPAAPDDLSALTALRYTMFPDDELELHREQLEALIQSPDYGVFVAVENGELVGFAEVARRSDYVNGCDTSPVAFLEAIYVTPDCRRRGCAGALVAAVEAWARDQGLTELGSDALLENLTSHQMHEALGFEETERVVYFRKEL